MFAVDAVPRAIASADKGAAFAWATFAWASAAAWLFVDRLVHVVACSSSVVLGLVYRRYLMYLIETVTSPSEWRGEDNLGCFCC